MAVGTHRAAPSVVGLVWCACALVDDCFADDCDGRRSSAIGGNQARLLRTASGKSEKCAGAGDAFATMKKQTRVQAVRGFHRLGDIRCWLTARSGLRGGREARQLGTKAAPGTCHLDGPP